VRVFMQDESRFGLLTVRRRRLTARDIQPIDPVQPIFESFYVCKAVASSTDERFLLKLPSLNATTLNATTFQLLDDSEADKAQRLTLSTNVRLVFFPPYGLELNPIERVRRHMKDDLTWQQFTNLEADRYIWATCGTPMMGLPEWHEV
jgi:putative transposase